MPLPVQTVSLLLAHEDATISEAAMDVVLEYSTKKSPTSVSSDPRNWSTRLQSYMSFSCRLKVRFLRTSACKQFPRHKYKRW